MTDDRWALVDEYIAERLLPPDMALESALAASDAAGLRAINVSPAQGKLLFLLAKSIGARRVLELGTLGGYSAIWLARALPAGGRLTTIEVDEHAAAVARSNFTHAGCEDLVDLRVGSALDVLPRLEAEGAGPFDFVFIDADKASYPEYLKWSIRLGHVGTLILADNVVRKGGVVDGASGDAAIEGVRRFYEALAVEPRVSATAIQTVGVKGYDGLAVVLITG